MHRARDLALGDECWVAQGSSARTVCQGLARLGAEKRPVPCCLQRQLGASGGAWQ